MFLLRGNYDCCKTSSPVAQRPLSVGFSPCSMNRMLEKTVGVCGMTHSGWLEKHDAYSVFSIDLVSP